MIIHGITFAVPGFLDMKIHKLVMYLCIALPPMISFNPSPIQGIVGSPLTIECIVETVSGVSTVNISWIGPGGPIMNNTRVTISPTTRNGNIFTSNLSFTYLTEDDDDGSYTCNVMILTTSKSQSVALQPLNSKTVFLTTMCTYVLRFYFVMYDTL